MSIKDKINNAKPSTWLTDGMTDIEKAVMEERVKWLKVIAGIRRELEDKSVWEWVNIDGHLVLAHFIPFDKGMEIIDRKVNEVEHDRWR